MLINWSPRRQTPPPLTRHPLRFTLYFLSMRLLITGVRGFAGSVIAHHLHEHYEQSYT